MVGQNHQPIQGRPADVQPTSTPSDSPDPYAVVEIDRHLSRGDAPRLSRLYMDVHIKAAITAGVRRRGIDVVTAQDDESTRNFFREKQ
jgi:hypothetical protein